MSLQIVYGRVGTGKSEYICNLIKQDCEKVYIIVPEQFSFTAEKKLLEVLEKSSVINAEVLTFNRMADRVFKEVGGINKHLSNVGKAMLIYNTLLENQKKLKFLGKNAENTNLVSRTIKDLKKHGITANALEKSLSSFKEEVLKLKLEDISLLYNSYENEINSNFIDEDDVLTMLAKKIDESNIFDNSNIYIDEFSGFTSQEYLIIEKLLKKAKKVTLTVCTNSLEESTYPETDIFYSNKEFANRIINIAKKTNTKVLPSIKLENTYRFKTDELKHLEKNMYDFKFEEYTRDVKNITLTLCENPYSEIENVAKNIIKIVREKNYRYNEISVITKNIDTYSSLVRVIFNKYNIPVFIDEQKDLSQNILIKYVLSLLDIFSNNYSYESMFNYIKTGFLKIASEDIFKLENYVVKCGIRGKKWYSEDWNYGEDEVELEKLNSIRRIIIEPLVSLKNKLENKKTVRDITLNLYEFLVQNNIEEKVNEKIEYLKSINKLDMVLEYENSKKILVDVLDEIVISLGDKNITFEKYKEILKIGFNESSLKKIPTTLDEVTVGDIDRSKSKKISVAFIIGINDGVFPAVNTNEGFLNDADRILLKEHGLEVAKGTLEMLYEDQFNIYKAFCMAEEVLNLSYVSSDKEFKGVRPSILISKIKRIYPNLIEKSQIGNIDNEIYIENTTFDELLKNIRKAENGENINKIWYDVYAWFKKSDVWGAKLESALNAMTAINATQNLSKEVIEKLYGSTLKTSVSRLEQYQNCPFSFYLKYGLKLKEKEIFEIRAIDSGSFMHEIIEEFFERIQAEGINVKEISKEKIILITNSIIEEKLAIKKNFIFASSAKFIVLTNKLKKVVQKSIEYIVYQLKVSNFEVLGSEKEFGENKDYEAIKVELECGKAVEVTGKIDRIDIAKIQGENYVRIIDYKSSVKDIEMNQVVAGLQLQLIIYLGAIANAESANPAGILYFPLLEPLVRSISSETDEDIEKNIRKEFKMNGIVLADINIVRAMDKNIDTGHSDVIPVYVGKDNNISEKKSSAISKEEFENLQKNAMSLIKQISKEMLNGNISIKPVFDKHKKKVSCEYCKYKSICKFDPKQDEYMYV
ncbi:MAG: helicase-exonuclease AddAB subunit AddB [Lachnospiraceae bacterium]|jgi:ATP-dependent helicase/nuclease subunit B|nr:helicase-exonuclease AddAB subunit AddB [Lachnospiraceae bacterium]